MRVREDDITMSDDDDDGGDKVNKNTICKEEMFHTTNDHQKSIKNDGKSIQSEQNGNFKQGSCKKSSISVSYSSDSDDDFVSDDDETTKSSSSKRKADQIHDTTAHQNKIGHIFL